MYCKNGFHWALFVFLYPSLLSCAIIDLECRIGCSRPTGQLCGRIFLHRGASPVVSLFGFEQSFLTVTNHFIPFQRSSGKHLRIQYCRCISLVAHQSSEIDITASHKQIASQSRGLKSVVQPFYSAETLKVSQVTII